MQAQEGKSFYISHREAAERDGKIYHKLPTNAHHQKAKPLLQRRIIGGSCRANHPVKATLAHRGGLLKGFSFNAKARTLIAGNSAAVPAPHLQIERLVRIKLCGNLPNQSENLSAVPFVAQLGGSADADKDLRFFLEQVGESDQPGVITIGVKIFPAVRVAKAHLPLLHQ